MTCINSAKIFAAASLCAVLAAPIQASAPSYATVKASATPAQVKAGASTTLTIKVALISKDFHINSNKPNSSYSIPTVVTIAPNANITIGKIAYPKDEKVKEAYSPAPLLVYTRTPTIKAPIKISPKAPKGTLKISGEIKFQGCDHSSCQPPKTEKFTVNVTVK